MRWTSLLAGALAAIVTLTTAAAELPPLANAAPEAIAAHAKDRAAHREFVALRDELGAALAPIGKESDPKRLAAKADQPGIALAIAQHELLRIAAEAIATIATEERGPAFAQWLLGDIATMEELFTTGAPPSDPLATLRVLFRIWQSDPSVESGLLRRIAVATALEHATPVLPWSEWGDTSAATIDPVRRYAFYRDLWSTRKLFACFDELATWELRRVVDLPLYDEDILWFHDTMPARLKDGAPPLRSQEEIGNAAFLIPYRDASPTNGTSVQAGKPFYDGKRLTPAVMLEYGGVCGAVAKFGSFAARAFGVPAQPLGQEGHCALCWKHAATDWRTGNCGSEDDWSVSNLHGLWGAWSSRGAMIPLMASLHATPSFMTSQRSFALARLNESELRKRLPREMDIAKLCPTNVCLWRAMGEAIAGDENARLEEIRRFAEALLVALHDAPQVAIDILTLVENGKAFRAAPAKDRDRYTVDLVKAFAGAITDPKAFPGGEGQLAAAFRELLGRSVWLASGKTSGLGDWPTLAYDAVLKGTHGPWKDWWATAGASERARVVDLLAKVATSLTKRPELAEQALGRLVTLAESDDAVRSKAQKAADGIAESYAKSGKRPEALRVYRTMILAGERIAHRPWIRDYTEKALKIRD